MIKRLDTTGAPGSLLVLNPALNDKFSQVMCFFYS